MVLQSIFRLSQSPPALPTLRWDIQLLTQLTPALVGCLDHLHTMAGLDLQASRAGIPQIFQLLPNQCLQMKLCPNQCLQWQLHPSQDLLWQKNARHSDSVSLLGTFPNVLDVVINIPNHQCPHMIYAYNTESGGLLLHLEVPSSPDFLQHTTTSIYCVSRGSGHYSHHRTWWSPQKYTSTAAY